MIKKSKIFKSISALTGQVNVWKDIIEPLLSIENFRNDYNYKTPKFDGDDLHDIKDIWVDLDYQRLKKKLPKNIIPAYDGLSFNF